MTPRKYAETVARVVHGLPIVLEGVHYAVDVRGPEDFSYWVGEPEASALQCRVHRANDVLVDEFYEDGEWVECARHPELAGLAERAAGAVS